MMKNIEYDSDADAIAVHVRREKSDITAELTEHISIDMTNGGKVVGLEILDASEEISKLFGRIVGKKEIQHLLCQVIQKPNDQYLVQFKSPQNNQLANLLIPLYRSPLIA